MDKQYTCVIIDEDYRSMNDLMQQLSKTKQLTVINTFDDPISAMAWFRHRQEISFLFISVEMEICGIDIARMLRNHAEFILFIAASKEYAFRAINHGEGYFLRPVDPEDLLCFMEKLINSALARQSNAKISLDKK